MSICVSFFKGRFTASNDQNIPYSLNFRSLQSAERLATLLNDCLVPEPMRDGFQTNNPISAARYCRTIQLFLLEEQQTPEDFLCDDKEMIRNFYKALAMPVRES